MDNYENENLNPELEAALDSLMQLIDRVPKETVKMLCLPRYKQAVESINDIITFVKSDCEDAEVSMYFDKLTGTSLCLNIVADELNIYKIKAFCKAIEPATTMCVVPRADGRLEIGFTYEGAKIPLPPSLG